MMEHDIELTDLVPKTPHDSPLSGDEDADTKMIVEDKGNGEEGGSTAETVSTAKPDIISTAEPKTPPTTTTLFDNEDVTIPDTLVKMKNQKAKEKGIAFKDKKKKKDQDQIEKDTEVALKIQTHLDEEARTKRERQEKASKDSLAEMYDELKKSLAARLEVSTAEPKTPPTTTTLFDNEDVTIPDTLVKMKNQKAKEKGIAFKDKKKKKDQDQIEKDTEVALKIQTHLDEEARTKRERQEKASKDSLAEMYDEVQAQIDADHESAIRLTHEEQKKYTVEEKSKLLAGLFERRKKQLAKERAEAIRSKLPTKN
uniref:Uncharacterized protein n=1 Tax=Tanacetum cinerariifolium TaxID=118510 RepID=A0A6L2P3F9_TANCI|nr:hypothetical protein [Tanacetum cinerariifolium]